MKCATANQFQIISCLNVIYDYIHIPFSTIILNQISAKAGFDPRAWAQLTNSMEQSPS
jgi:hypothetical protein